MRWTRLLSGILGTLDINNLLSGCVLRLDSGVIPLIRFRVCDSSLIDGTVFRSDDTVTRIGSNCTRASTWSFLDLWWTRERVLVANLRRCVLGT